MRSSIFVLLLTLSISLFAVTSGIAFASSDNWSEVVRFTDEGTGFQTEPFTIDHVDWRIRWEYEPDPEVPDEHPALHVYVYAQEAPGTWFESIRKNGTEETSGTLYIHDRNGTFFLIIIRAVQSYTLIVEQNLDSIPEFPSWKILPLILLVTIVVTAYRKKFTKHSQIHYRGFHSFLSFLRNLTNKRASSCARAKLLRIWICLKGISWGTGLKSI